MALEKFHFEASDGTKIDVPFLNDKLSYKQARKLRKQYSDNTEELGDAFTEAALDKADLEKVENLSLRDYNRFVTGWMEAEDTPVGES